MIELLITPLRIGYGGRWLIFPDVWCCRRFTDGQLFLELYQKKLAMKMGNAGGFSFVFFHFI